MIVKKHTEMEVYQRAFEAAGAKLETAMERRVALKVLSAGHALDERAVRRFQREARIIGKLSHPNIVAVYATGVDNDTPYIAMEYVDGETLDKVLERKRPEETPRSGWRQRIASRRTRAISSSPVPVPRPTAGVSSTTRWPRARGSCSVVKPCRSLTTRRC